MPTNFKSQSWEECVAATPSEFLRNAISTGVISTTSNTYRIPLDDDLKAFQKALAAQTAQGWTLVSPSITNVPQAPPTPPFSSPSSGVIGGAASQHQKSLLQLMQEAEAKFLAMNKPEPVETAPRDKLIHEMTHHDYRKCCAAYFERQGPAYD